MRCLTVSILLLSASSQVLAAITVIDFEVLEIVDDTQHDLFDPYVEDGFVLTADEPPTQAGQLTRSVNHGDLLNRPTFFDFIFNFLHFLVRHLGMGFISHSCDLTPIGVIAYSA